MERCLFLVQASLKAQALASIVGDVIEDLLPGSLLHLQGGFDETWWSSATGFSAVLLRGLEVFCRSS